VKLATDGLATNEVDDKERFKLRHVRLRAAVQAGVSEHLAEDFRAVWTYFSTSADKDWSALALKLVMGADKSTLAPVLDDIGAWLDGQDNLKVSQSGLSDPPQGGQLTIARAGN